MTDRAEHDKRPAIEHERDTKETFDHFIFIPSLYDKPDKPHRLRLLYRAQHGLVELSEENTTSESVTSEVLSSGVCEDIHMTPTQVYWLHKALGQLIARFESEAAAQEQVHSALAESEAREEEEAEFDD